MPFIEFGPELIVIFAAFLVLLLEIVSPRKSANTAVFVTGFGLLASLAASIYLQNSQHIESATFGSMLRADSFSWLIKSFMAGAALFVWIFSYNYLKQRVKALSEYCFMFLTSTFGLMLVPSCTNFIMFVIALETASLGMYVLSASIRGEKASIEAGLKFFLTSSFASAILIWGMSILYGLSGSLDFGGMTSSSSNVQDALTRYVGIDTKPFPLLGILAVFVGVGFKITLFPFHLWAPDVYQGSPTSFTAFLATVSKVAGIAILIRIVAEPFAPLVEDFGGLLGALACFTMIAASTAALMQTDAKRLLAYSSISHAGFMVVGIAAVKNISSSQSAFGSVLFYLGAYILATACAFVLLMALENKRKTTSLNVFNGLWKTDPKLTFVMIVALASLAGLPPTVGFIGKFFIFKAAYMSGMMLVLACMLIATVVSLFFYFKIVRCMILNPPEDEVSGFVTGFQKFVLVLSSLAILFLLFFSGPIYNYCVSVFSNFGH